MNFLDNRLPDRFWSKVQPCPMSGCWIWIASTNSSGYGTFASSSGSVGSHRIAYEAANGPIPEGLQIDHGCRTRSCCNPAHLQAVTRTENLLRGQTIVSRAATATECPLGHAYDAANTGHYRGKRTCRACVRRRAGERYHSDPERFAREARERRARERGD